MYAPPILFPVPSVLRSPSTLLVTLQTPDVSTPARARRCPGVAWRCLTPAPSQPRTATRARAPDTGIYHCVFWRLWAQRQRFPRLRTDLPAHLDRRSQESRALPDASEPCFGDDRCFPIPPHSRHSPSDSAPSCFTSRPVHPWRGLCSAGILPRIIPADPAPDHPRSAHDVRLPAVAADPPPSDGRGGTRDGGLMAFNLWTVADCISCTQSLFTVSKLYISLAFYRWARCTARLRASAKAPFQPSVHSATKHGRHAPGSAR